MRAQSLASLAAAISERGRYLEKRRGKAGSVDWEKPSSELSDVLSRAAASFPLVERRKMFGGLSLFLNGHMFAGVHGAKIVLRLSEEDRADAQTRVGAFSFEPMPGRTMKEYVVLPEPEWSEPDLLEHWLLRSIGFVGTLPPKEPKPRKPRRTG